MDYINQKYINEEYIEEQRVSNVSTNESRNTELDNERKYEMKRLERELLNNSYRETEALNVNQSQNLSQNNSNVYNRNEQQEVKKISELIDC